MIGRYSSAVYPFLLVYRREIKGRLARQVGYPLLRARLDGLGARKRYCDYSADFGRIARIERVQRMIQTLFSSDSREFLYFYRKKKLARPAAPVTHLEWPRSE